MRSPSGGCRVFFRVHPSGAYISITSNRGCSFCGFFLQPFLRGGGQFLPLGKGHKLTRLGECGVFAQLHLCKDHISPVGSDHIQLAEAGTVIHGKNAAALFSAGIPPRAPRRSGRAASCRSMHLPQICRAVDRRRAVFAQRSIVRRRAVALMLAKAVLGIGSASISSIYRSRVTLASTEAAAIEAHRLSPLTTLIAGMSSSFLSFPSTRASTGAGSISATARFMARYVAPLMFSASISSTVAKCDAERHGALADDVVERVAAFRRELF